MTEENSFVEVMQQLRSGDQDAAVEVFDRFAHRLIGLARVHLDSKMRQKIDPEDIMQSAFKSFFHKQAEGRFDLANWDNLWSLLVVITLRKCGHKVEYFRAACRDVQRECLPVLADDDSASSWQVVANDPTPVQAAIMADTLGDIMASLNSDRSREMLELRLKGFSVQEISEKVGRAEHTVRRILKRVQRRMQRMRDA